MSSGRMTSPATYFSSSTPPDRISLLNRSPCASRGLGCSFDYSRGLLVRRISICADCIKCCWQRSLHCALKGESPRQPASRLHQLLATSRPSCQVAHLMPASHPPKDAAHAFQGNDHLHRHRTTTQLQGNFTISFSTYHRQPRQDRRCSTMPTLAHSSCTMYMPPLSSKVPCSSMAPS